MERSRAEHSSLGYLWVGGLALAAVLRAALIDRHGLWNNELITFVALKLPYWELVNERLSVNHMPLYFLLEKAWTSVFGLSEISMRTIGAIFGWLAVWATGRLARRIGGLKLGVPVVFAGAIHPLWLETSLEARMYSMVAWAAAESFDAYFAMARAELTGDRRASRRAMARWVATTAIGIHVHMLHGAVLAYQAADAVVRRWIGRMPLKRMALSWLAVGAICVPISVAWFVNQTKVGDERSLQFEGMGILYRQLMRFLIGDYRSIESGAMRATVYLCSYILFAAALAGTVMWLRSSRAGGAGGTNGERRRDLISLAGVVPAFLAGIYLAQAISSAGLIGTERYFAGIYAAVMVVGVGAIVHLGERWPKVGGGLLAVLLATQAALTIGYYRGPGDGLREAVEVARRDAETGRGLVAVASSGATYGLGDYYGRDMKDRSLMIQRETEPERIRSQLLQFSEVHPEFWVLTYRERRDRIRRVLFDPEGDFVALGEPREFGSTTVQLFAVRKSDSSEDVRAALPAEFEAAADAPSDF
jgi:hypothetical protein